MGDDWDDDFDEYKLPEGAIPLGYDTWYLKVHDHHGKWIAINEFHRHPKTNKWCGGFVPFNVETAFLTAHSDKWEVESYDPLTLSPSIVCTMPNCGHHGFIRNGRWVPA